MDCVVPVNGGYTFATSHNGWTEHKHRQLGRVEGVQLAKCQKGSNIYIQSFYRLCSPSIHTFSLVLVEAERKEKAENERQAYHYINFKHFVLLSDLGGAKAP